jgi:DNA replication protein DnaD
MMNRMGEQMGLMLGNMKNTAERCNLMLQNETMMRDREMRQDMDRIRTQLKDMTGQLEESVQSMERITKRMRDNLPTN